MRINLLNLHYIKFRILEPLVRLPKRQLSFKNATPKICIVGSGPAGFYAAQYLVKHLPSSEIDILEKLPVPFGLVRYGVAPDHPEVKNVINTFTKTAENPKVNFYGNVCLGKDVSLQELRECYHAVILAYGADLDRKLNIPEEDNCNKLISAREFVAWYNGLPGFENLSPNFDGETVSIIGQGNVGVDAARILLTSISVLSKTDITDYALHRLSSSRIRKVYLIGRRGPLQAAFTIKELREMLKLPNVTTIWRQTDFNSVEEIVPSLGRPRKRITELMLKSMNEQNIGSESSNCKQFLPIFYRSPKSVDANGTLNLSINKLFDDKAISTNDTETIQSDLILRSIGYTSQYYDESLNFDSKIGHVPNLLGRVLKKQLTGSDNTIDDIEDKFECGLYVTGWLGTGPTGVILTTMNNSFAVADTICKDFELHLENGRERKPGIDWARKENVVTWNGWNRIDKAEIAAGRNVKPREKIVDIERMLSIAIS